MAFLDLALPGLWGGTGVAAEGFGEVAGVGEACGRGYGFEVPVAGSEEGFDGVDAALEDVLVWGYAGALAEGAGEVKDAEAGYRGYVFQVNFRGEVGGYVFEDTLELEAGDASLVGRGAGGGVAVFAD